MALRFAIISWSLLVPCLGMLLFGSGAASAIAVSTLRPNHLVAETSYHRFELKDGIFSIFFRESNGQLKEGNRATFNYIGARDSIWFTNSSDASWERPCQYLQTTKNFTSISSTFDNSKPGYVQFTAVTLLSPTCQWNHTYIMVDNATLYTTSKVNFTIMPWEVKLEVRVRCPWREEIRRELGLTPTVPLFLRARETRPIVAVNFTFTDNINPNLVDFPHAAQPENDFDRHVYNACTTALPPGQSVWPPMPLRTEFNFSATGGMSFQTENVKASLLFLAWAAADQGFFTDVDGKLLKEDAIFRQTSVTGTARLRFEYADELFYDPTLEFLFADTYVQDPGPAVNPAAQALNTADTESIRVAMAASLSVAAILIVAAITIFVAVLRRKKQREVARVKEAVQRQQRAQDPERQTNKTTSPSVSSPSQPQTRAWSPSLSSQLSLRNVDEAQ